MRLGESPTGRYKHGLVEAPRDLFWFFLLVLPEVVALLVELPYLVVSHLQEFLFLTFLLFLSEFFEFFLGKFF